LSIDRRDSDFTRFFWYRVKTDGKENYDTARDVVIYRVARLPFGLTCNTFFLSATIRELADMYKSEFPTAANLSDSSTFVDDFVAGAENDDAVIKLHYELISLMNQIRLPMAKWATSSPTLKEMRKDDDLEYKVVTQVLGIGWDTESDTFSIDPTDTTEGHAKGPTTKRQILQLTARLYDPLGLQSPISVIGKLLFQDTWRRGISWDELLPPDLGALWNVWVSS
jgi:hypothetical protein